MATKSNETTLRTQAIISTYRGLPGEFYMLKGLLCLDGALAADVEKRKGWKAGVKIRKQVDRLYDGLMIAGRLDELNAEDKAKGEEIAARRTG